MVNVNFAEGRNKIIEEGLRTMKNNNNKMQGYNKL